MTVLLLFAMIGIWDGFLLQFLPEKYSYFRRVERANAHLEAGEESTPIDCVICMAAIDVSQRCNECMVSKVPSQFDILFFNHHDVFWQEHEVLAN